jgi:hypothetical protein
MMQTNCANGSSKGGSRPSFPQALRDERLQGGWGENLTSTRCTRPRAARPTASALDIGWDKHFDGLRHSASAKHGAPMKTGFVDFFKSLLSANSLIFGIVISIEYQFVVGIVKTAFVYRNFITDF